jgi:hypothetical protein
MANWWDEVYAEGETQVAPGPTYSKVDDFKKQQSDGTKVGKVEAAIMPKIASGIESAKKSPFGFIVNPAMTALEKAGKYIIQPATQAVSTALLTPQALAKGKGLESFRFASQQSKKISMGQALAGSVGQIAGSVLPDQITPTFMDSGFNIFDQKQRDKAFRDEALGIFASGVTDLTLAALGTKGTGMATRSAVKSALGPKRIVSPEDMNIFRTKVEETKAWAANQTSPKPTSGLGILIDDAVKETDLTKLASNPLIAETANPYRTATIIGKLDNHNDVGDYLLAERGDVEAFNRLMQSKPILADHIDNYGINKFDPITDWSKVTFETLDPKLTVRYQAIIDAKRKTDPAFSDALDDLLSKSKSGVFESYQPGKFGFVETIDLAKKKLMSQAKYGELKLFGKDGNEGWKTTVYQSNVYDRAIRTIAWVGSGRPQGHINVSNPRRFESANDLLSDLNRLQMLRGTEGAQFKRDMVDMYLRAQDDTQRALMLARIEQQVMLRLAKQYGVRGIEDIRTSKDAVDQITKWHVGTSERRQTLQQYATKHGFIPDEDGNLNVSNFFSISNEAQTMPMLDFRKLEIEVIMNTKRSLGARAPISRGQELGAFASKNLMHVGAFLDTANMIFNNLNLLRFAYIPKNSMVDPMARGMMALESTELLGNAIPGTKNIIHNTSLRAEQAKRWIPGTPGYVSRRQEKFVIKEMDILAGDLKKAVEPWEKAQAAYDAAEAAWQTARLKVAKAEAAAKKASKSNQGYADSAKHAADEDLFNAQKTYSQASDDLARTGERVQGLSTLIEKKRGQISASAIEQGALRQRKHLGQDAEFIEVDGKQYAIAGLADSNIRGANAYMSEIDSTTNFYSTAMQSEYSRRLKAEGSRFVQISRNEGKPYWNALAHVANRQIRNELDMPLGMMMRGDSDIDILRWLYTGDAGKEYRRRMSSRAGKDLTRDDFLSWITDTNAKLRKMYPSEELRKIILQREISVKETEILLRNRTDLLETIEGPNINLNDLNWAEKRLANVSGATDAAWRILSATENRMVRNPMFLSYTRDELKTLIQAARRSGIDPSDAVVNNQMRQIAYRNALARVEQTLYSSRRLTNGMYVMRYGMSFPLAFFNSQAVALKLMAKNPMNAYWYNSIATAFDNFEAYEDQDGNTYKSIADVPKGTQVTVKYPLPFGDKLPDWAKQALKPYTDSRGGGLKWNPKQMEFMVADPSVSWFGTVGISQLLKDGFTAPGGLWTVHGEDIAKTLRNTFGDDFYENSILYGGYPQEGGNLVSTAFNTMAPAYLRSAMDKIGIFRSDRFVDEVFTNYRTLYSEWDRNGRIGEPPSMERAAKAAGNMSFIRSVVQFFAPISTTFDPVTRAATTYYSDLLAANGGDYDAAQKQMEEEWGIDSIALIGSNQRNVAGVAANYSDIKMIRNNPALLQKIGRWDTKYAQMLSAGYGELTDDYSTEIAAIYKRMNFPGGYNSALTQKKTSEELRVDIESRRGWAEYQKATDWRDSVMAQYGVGSANEVRYQSLGIKAQFDSMVKVIQTEFPGWADNRNASQRDFWGVTVPAMKEIANDPKWRQYADGKGDKWTEISYWLTQADAFRQQYTQTMSSDARKADLKAQFSQFHYNFMQVASDEFSTFASRWLENMPELSTELVAG